jgi:hypothetical protein
MVYPILHSNFLKLIQTVEKLSWKGGNSRLVVQIVFVAMVKDSRFRHVGEWDDIFTQIKHMLWN